MKCKRKTKLEMAQDKAQAAINKTNETIEELGNHTSNLYDSLTSIQDSFDHSCEYVVDFLFFYRNVWLSQSVPLYLIN